MILLVCKVSACTVLTTWTTNFACPERLSFLINIAVFGNRKIRNIEQLLLAASETLADTRDDTLYVNRIVK